MYKQIIGALVIGLAGACWMVAQYAVGQPAVAPMAVSSVPPLIDLGEQRMPALPGAALENTSPFHASAPAIPQSPTLTGSNPQDELFGGVEMPLPAIPPAPPPLETPDASPSKTPAIRGFPTLPQVPSALPTPPLYLINGDGGSGSTGVGPEPGIPGADTPAPKSEALPVPAQGPPNVWVGAEYLLWFVRNAQTPSLLQSTGSTGTATNLFPSSNGIDYGAMSGIKGTLGFWLNDLQTLGLETTYFWFGENSRLNAFQGGNQFAIGHPYIDVGTGNGALDPVSALQGMSGTSVIRSGLKINGGDSDLLLSPGVQFANFSILLGFRYLDLQEYLNINDSSVGSGSTLNAGDSFTTRNQFYGGQTGLRYSWTGDVLSFTLIGKIAYGALNETVGIEGSSTMTNAAGSSTRGGGIYALNSNIGNYNQTTMAVIPEFNAKMGWHITPWATATLGYNFLYINQVVRPGSQIDPVINPANLPFGNSTATSTAAKPAFAFHNENFWMQGVNIGMTFQY